MLICLQYSKEEEARFLSHLDLMTAMERAFRRAQLPLAFSEGFNPHPRVAYASALAVGVTSDGEYLDLQLAEDIPAEEVIKRLRPVLPVGLKVLAAVPVTRRKQSLMAVVNMARYRVELSLLQTIEQKDVDALMEKILSRSSWIVYRQGKRGDREVEIRPGIFRLQGWLENTASKKKLCVEMDVQTGSSGNVKPEEVMEVLKRESSFSWEKNMRFHRLGLFIREKGKIWTPLEKS